ncbi:hypothetical protein niasHS_017617 [Heterodera schachtii]|uniref:Uncharacterized protein n=1 Tax=Heterodera schachtii TaxID=97005 RepID=A0ABD2I107_HETSC
MAMPFSPPPPSVCPLVFLLYSQSPVLRLLFLTQSIASFVSLLVLVFGMVRLLIRPLVPTHQRNTVLLLSLCLSLLLGNVGVLLSTLYHLHVPLFRPTSSLCFWLSFSIGDCLMIRSLLNVSLFSAYLSGVCFALERVVSSLLLLRNRRIKWAITFSLAILQWLLSFLAVFQAKHSAVSAPFVASEFPPISRQLFPHCVMLTPSPTQLHPHFFVLLGMQAFVLAIFSILTYHNHFDPMTKCELARRNPIVAEQVLATEQSLPIASFAVALFLFNTLLDRSFLRTIVNTFGGREDNENEGTEQKALRGAIWSEFQTLALPLASLLFVWILFLQNRNLWDSPPASDGFYGRMRNGEMAKEKPKEIEQNKTRNIEKSIKERPLVRGKTMEGTENGEEGAKEHMEERKTEERM